MTLDKMLFVVGNSRSGTTLMGRILGNHDDVLTFGELHFYGQLWSPASTVVFDTDLASELFAKLLCIQREGYRTHGEYSSYLKEALTFCQGLSNSQFHPAELFSAFLSYETLRSGKSIPCDQTPRNVFYIDEIIKQYPQAKIVNMIRDPRDVLQSQKRKWKRRFLGGTDLPFKETVRDWINYHPITISRIWHTAVTAADKFSDNENVKNVYFEKLLSDPVTTIKEICEFVEIGFSTTMLDVPQVGSSVDADKPTKIGINPRRTGQWNISGNNDNIQLGILNSSEVYINQRLNAELMKRHKYTPIFIRPNFLRLMLSLLSFPLKILFALLFNLDRIKNLRETLKRRL